MSGLKTVFETAITDTWTATQGLTKGDKPGDIRWVQSSDSTGPKCYKCVILNNGSDNIAPIIGLAAYYYGVAGDPLATGYDASTVTMDRTDFYGQAAGIWISIPADASRCWIQIKGLATGISTLLNGNVTDGGTLTGVGAAIDGELDLPTNIDDPLVGFVIDETAFTIICDFPF